MAPFWSAPASSLDRATATFSLSWPTAEEAKPTSAEANEGMAEGAKLGRRAAAVKVGQSVRRLARLKTGGLQGCCVPAAVVARYPAPAKRRLAMDLLQPASTPLGIVATTVVFIQRSKVTGRLLVPYLAWVSFAAVLNFAIWRVNG